MRADISIKISTFLAVFCISSLSSISSDSKLMYCLVTTQTLVLGPDDLIELAGRLSRLKGKDFYKFG